MQNNGYVNITASRTPLRSWALELQNNSNSKDRPITNSNKRLAGMVQLLQADIGENQYTGLPTHLIDPKVLIANLPTITNIDELPDSELERCYKPIIYEQGSIATIDGFPIWEKLDGEQLDYYNLFKQYKDLKYFDYDIKTKTAHKDDLTAKTAHKDDLTAKQNTARGDELASQIHTTGTKQQSGDSLNSTNSIHNINSIKLTHRPTQTRSLHRLSQTTQLPVPLLKVLNELFHWQVRCKAFDAFKQAELEFRRQREQELLQEAHSRVADNLVHRAMDYLMDDRNLKKLDPKVALQMVELGVKYGRVSLGLQGDKPGTLREAAEMKAQSYASMPGASNTINLFNQYQGAGQEIEVRPSSTGAGPGSPGTAPGSTLKQNKNQNRDQNQGMDNMTRILHVLNTSGAFKIAEGSGSGNEDGNKLNTDDGENLTEYRDSLYDDVIDVEVTKEEKKVTPE